MINTILAKKGNVSQTFVEGFRIPVTKVIAGPCTVTQIKSMDKDGYLALQLGFETKKKHPRYKREVRIKEETDLKVGDIVKVSDIFKPGDVIAVSGVSKGKGFSSGIQRFHFKGGPRTHGQSDRERAPGSLGQTTTPGRVYKGKRMAGRMGGIMSTIKNLHIISVNDETNEVEISGHVPGTPGGLITLVKIKSGSLKDLEHEVVAQVTEGEAPVEEKKEEAPTNA